MSLKVVSVYGATGQQGLSVVKSLLDTYKVRALTRSPEKLKDLTHPNLTVIQVDIDDRATLTAAFQGSWAVFANTFSDYSKPEGTETKLGNMIVDAAVEAGAEWFVWSGCAEGVALQAWEEKAATMQYAREVAKKTGLKNVFVQVGAYMSNFYGLKPEWNAEDNVVEFKYVEVDDNTYFPLASPSTDLGPIVKAILANPDEWLNDEIPIVSEALSLSEVAAAYSKAHAVAARHVIVETTPLFDALPRLRQMYAAWKATGYYPQYHGGREHEINAKAKKLYPGVKTMEKWFREAGRLDSGKPASQ